MSLLSSTNTMHDLTITLGFNLCFNVLSARYGISNLDAAIEGASDDMTVVDAASLRRQVITAPNKKT